MSGSSATDVPGYLWSKRASLVLAACAGFVIWIAPQVVGHYPVPTDLSGFSTDKGMPASSLGVALQLVLFLAGATVAFVVADTLCTLVRMLSARASHWDWHEYSLATLILLGAFASWQWTHMPWRHPTAAPGDELPLAAGRLYRTTVERDGQEYGVLFFETTKKNVLTRNVVCADDPRTGKLTGHSVLDHYHVECIWRSGSAPGIEQREIVFIEDGRSLAYLVEGHVEQASVTERKPTLRVVEDADGSAASQCRLEAEPAAARCGSRRRLLESGTSASNWPVPQAWHVTSMQRTEITLRHGKQLVCLAAEVDGALLHAGVTRLPALVLVELDHAEDRPLSVSFVYDTDASCERIDEGALSGLPLYRWSDATARQTRQSHGTLMFSRQ